jgi:hypothetical protein
LKLKEEKEMTRFQGYYVVDEEGNRKAVVVPIADWEQLVDALEELDDIRAYDDAKGDPTEPIPFEQAISGINKGISD